MENTIKESSALYRHLILEGTSYEAGKKLGEYFKSGDDSTRQFRINTMDPMKKEERHIYEAMEYFDRYCPGINEEIRGMSEGLGVKVENLLCYLESYRSEGGCSQMIVLPRITKGGNIYLARNYDYCPTESDLCLITSKVQGKFSHIGFSELGFGRTDGMNEHGLCISMSNAAPGLTSNSIGFEFWVIIRLVLDFCRNTDEAIAMIQSIPTSTYTNFAVVDKNGEAALIEVAGDKKVVQRINNSYPKQYILATNHFTSKDMLQFDNRRYWDSVARYLAMELRINDAIPDVDEKELKAIQSDLIPLGTCAHNYASSFGTLWSVIYNVSDIKLEACFGSPRANPWHKFDLTNPVESSMYTGKLPESDKKPIWKRLDPGAVNCDGFYRV